MPKTKKEQAEQSVELADVWPDPPVEEIGSPVRTISNKACLRELAALEIELVKLQEWIRHEGLRVAIIFEGRDAAGKGGAIKTITLSLNPRFARVVALPMPSEREQTQWYFQRYAVHLPAAGEIVLFDRSWYNRAGVEHVMGFCTDADYREFLRSCPEFERMLVRSGIVLAKYGFSVSDAEQERRFQSRIEDPTKRWKLQPDGPPVAGPLGRVLEGEGHPPPAGPDPVLPPRQQDDGYTRPPITEQTFVPEVF